MHSENRKSISTSSRIDLNDSAIVMPAAAPPCRVLIVDDDPHVAMRISRLLEAGGYEIHSARSGADAMRILDAKACHIVLTDWHMPDMDGIELCRTLRLRQSDDYVYILMLTVRAGTADTLAGLAAGADDYVVKGAAPEEILARVGVGRRIAQLGRSLSASKQENELTAITDSVTGVCNRSYLMKHLPRELTRSQRYNHPLAVIACDIDDFTQITVRYGHAAGDEILKSFVRRGGKCIRQGIDWLARFAGGEFIFVLPETSLDGAICVVQRLREAVSVRPISTSAGPIRITASMGVTALETAEDLKSGSSAELLRAADRQLYVSKQIFEERAAADAAEQAGKQGGEPPRVKCDIH